MLFCLAPLQAQTTTATTDSTTPMVVATYNAGDTVTITGEIDTSDPVENEEMGESEVLVITTSTDVRLGSQNISTFSQPATVTFTASGSGAVSAYVSGADGDETGTITVVISSGCSTTVPTLIPSPPNCPISNWSPSQTNYVDQFAVTSAEIGSGLTIPKIAAAVCGSNATDCAAIQNAGFAAVSAYGYLGYLAGYAASPDSNYTVVAPPTVPTLTPIAADAQLTSALAAALNALNTNSYTIVAYTQAALTSENRAAGAADAGAGTSEPQQFSALQSYEKTLASLVQAEPALLANLQAAWAAGYPGSITASVTDAADAQTAVATNGFPAAVTQILTQAGLSGAAITLLDNFYIGQNAGNVVSTFPSQLGNPALATAINAFAAGPMGFAQIPGALVRLSVGADDTVWGINSSQQIFAYNYTTSGWSSVPGALAQIAVGSSTAVWGLNAEGQIYTWNSASSSWKEIPGSLAHIAVGADGDVWGLNAQANIYHYNAQTGLFSQVPGSLASIAVGSAGAVYGINSSGSIYWYNPGTGSFQYVGATFGFAQISVGVDGGLWGVANNIAYHYNVLTNTMNATTGSIAQVSVGSGGSIWGLDPFGNIFQWNAQSANWVQVPGTLTSIAVGANGAVWGLDSAQGIHRLTGNLIRPLQTLATIPGPLNQISVGVDGSVWGINSNNSAEYFNTATQKFQIVSIEPIFAQLSVGAGSNVWGIDVNGNIYQYNAPGGYWSIIPGQLSLVQVGADGSVWGVNASGQTFTYNFSNNSWTNIPGQLANTPGKLSVGVDGTVWGINGQQQIYRFNAKSQSWVNVPGSLSQISVGNATNIWGVNAQESVYYYDTASQSWVNIPGAYLKQVSVSFDGSVWGVDGGGNLYQWNPGTKNFTLAGSGVTQVLVGNAAAVWGMNSISGAAFSWF